MKTKRSIRYSHNLTDVIIALICCVGIGVSLAFYVKDVNISLATDEQEPIGVIYFKKNTAQRRLMNHNLWERLRVATPVYEGDRIRTGNLSEASLIFNDKTEITLYENTLVQVFGASGNSLDFMNGSISVISSKSEEASGETIKVKTGNKVLSLSQHTSALISTPAVEAQKETSGHTVVAVSSGEVYVKPVELERKSSNNKVVYETIEAGSVAQYEVVMPPAEEINDTKPLISLPKLLPGTKTESKTEVKQESEKQNSVQTDNKTVEEKVEKAPKTKTEKIADFKVLMPSASYSVTQNKDEIKYVPFFWTDLNNIRVEFSYSSKFNEIIDTEYLSSATHKASVYIDFAKDGDILYWRALPAAETYDPSKTYSTGKITVRSEEKKQEELQQVLAQVYGQEQSQEMTNQVIENAKTVTKNEAVAMSDIKPATQTVTKKTAPKVEEKPVQTINSYIREKQIKSEPIADVTQTQTVDKTESSGDSKTVAKTETKENTATVKPETKTEKKTGSTTAEKPAVTKKPSTKPVTTKPSVTKKPGTTGTTTKPVTTKPATTKPAATRTETTAKAETATKPVETTVIPDTTVVTEKTADVKQPEKAETVSQENVIADSKPVSVENTSAKTETASPIPVPPPSSLNPGVIKPGAIEIVGEATNAADETKPEVVTENTKNTPAVIEPVKAEPSKTETTVKDNTAAVTVPETNTVVTKPSETATSTSTVKPSELVPGEMPKNTETVASQTKDNSKPEVKTETTVPEVKDSTAITAPIKTETAVKDNSTAVSVPETNTGVTKPSETSKTETKPVTVTENNKTETATATVVPKIDTTDKSVTEAPSTENKVEENKGNEISQASQAVSSIQQFGVEKPVLTKPASSKVFSIDDFADEDEPSITFEWKPVENAQDYKFEIVDEKGRLVCTSTVRTNRFVLYDFEVFKDDGNYTWKVTAMTKNSGTVYNSETSSRQFQIQFETPEDVTEVSRTNLITFD